MKDVNWPSKLKTPGLTISGHDCTRVLVGKKGLHEVALSCSTPYSLKQSSYSELGDAVLVHWTRFREVPGSNPGADQYVGFFWWFSSVIEANAELDFHYHDPFVRYSSYP